MNEVKIENCHPVPEGRFAVSGECAILRRLLLSMRVGESFDYNTNKTVYLAAKQVKIRITTRKLNSGGYRVWKLKQAPSEQPQLTVVADPRSARRAIVPS